MNTTLLGNDFLQLKLLDEGIVELALDRRNESVNKLDTALVQAIDAALDALAARSDVRGVLLSSAKDAFLAGADMAALWAMLGSPKDELLAFCRDTDRVLTRLEDLPVPIVCAINGYALGGGLETALCADYRVLAGDAQIGFPEVGFGILPGVGGTVRTPRLAGSAVALEWIGSGRSFKAEAALKAGIVDAVTEAAQLRDGALAQLRRAIGGELDWQARRARRRGGFVVDADAFAAARAQAQKAAKHYPAPLTIVTLLETCAPLDRDAAFAHEAEAFATLMQTPTAKSLVAVFLSSQQLKKKNKAHSLSSRRVNRSAVLGAGIMGGGIAYTTALKNMPVLLKDIAQPALDLGMNEARKLLAKQVETGKLKPEASEKILGSITPMLAFEQFDTVDIVVEAVVENLKIKQQVLGEVEKLVRPGTVLASNTSSLAIAEIAETLQRPEDVVGMHFFNPVHLMPLVEVIRGPRSRDEAVATTVAYALAMGKTPLVVKDCPGFLINRILGAYFSALMLLIRDGADFAQIDRVMESWGWPMGPCYLLDVAGLDTLDKAMAILGKAYPDVMGAGFTTAIQLLASKKRYGQKTGAGFFRYEADAKGKPKRSNDPETYALLATIQPNGTRMIGDDEILDRMMLAMILEAARCLDEGVAGSAIEVDAGMRLGTGFPAHHGGPLWYAEHLGLNEVITRSARYRALGGVYEVGGGLREHAIQNRSYYSELSGR